MKFVSKTSDKPGSKDLAFWVLEEIWGRWGCLKGTNIQRSRIWKSKILFVEISLWWSSIAISANVFFLWRLDIEFCISVSVEKCISFAELLHLYCGGAGVESFGGWRLEWPQRRNLRPECKQHHSHIRLCHAATSLHHTTLHHVSTTPHGTLHHTDLCFTVFSRTDL